MDYTLRSEQRQHLNLSSHAYETLINDIGAFSEKGGMSGIINRILMNYMDESPASISTAVEKKRLEYIDILKKEKGGYDSASAEDHYVNITSEEKKTIDYLCSAYKKSLTDHFVNNLPPKGHVLKIRLQNDIYDALGPAVPLSDECYKSAGNYIRAIIEDYTVQTLYRREEIYFRELYELIRSKLMIPAEHRPLLTLRAKNPTGKIIDYRIKLYDISSESASLYHYLITMSRSPKSPDNTYSPAVFRLSRIIKLYDTPSYGSGKITVREKKELEESIKKKSIPYILDNMDEYAIEFTPHGITMYNSILHLRPIADTSRTEILDSGNQIMYFTCTYRQIENYFFKFGKDARILSPKSAAGKFRQAYQLASEAYLTI